MKKPERYFYPAVFTYESGQEIAVDFPDLKCATSGINDDDALLSARELLGCVLNGLEEDGEEESWQVVTTVRQDVLNGLISKESPMGAALLGKKVGERFYVQVNQDYGYYAVVRAIQKGADDGSAQLNRY